jgi:class 3 adenylate cyclase
VAVPPETKYARLGGDRIAYQVLGEGPPDLVLVRRSYGHIDIGWEDPGISLFLRRLASFCWLILFNRRGTGPSDPLPLGPLPPWESMAEELEAVQDEVGSERAAIMAELDAGPTALLFAGTRRNEGAARQRQPQGRPDVPAGDGRVRRTVGAAAGAGTDADPAPAGVRAGAHRAWPLPGRPSLGATLVELPGSDVDLFWETPDLAVDAIQEFLTGVRRTPEPSRVLATVLFTDIVASTERAARLGDRRWRELLEVHDELAGRLVEQFHGQLVKTTGDGILAAFDGPGRAIRCAAAFGDELAGIDVQIRAGLHTGEIELRDGDVGGIAVHIAARVMAAAEPGRIVTSRTVHDLVVGSDIAMDDLGTRR